jgi:glycosyltransferase involved in cell wall biosynthesis
VVILSHTAQLGGAERALLRLLDALDAQSFDISVITFDEGDLVGELSQRGVQVTVVPLGDLNDFTRDQAGPRALLSKAREGMDFAARLTRAVKLLTPDLIVANSLKSAMFAAIVAPRVRCPWVWHLHDRLAPDYMPARTAAVLRLMAKSLPRHVIVNSVATLATLGRIRKRRASVAYPGLDESAFVDVPRQPRSELVGTLARISETKGQREFVQAAVRVASTHANARFRIVGAALFQDGNYERALRDQVSESGLSDRIEFTGWTSRAGEELASFDLFVHVPPVPEPFGQVVVEAMAVGTPVIGADAGGIREILDPGLGREVVAPGVHLTPLGLLVSPSDPAALARAVLWGLDHRDVLDSLAVECTRSARDRFSIGDTARIVQTVWRSSIPAVADRRLRSGSLS